MIHQLVLMAGAADLLESLHEGSVESPESVASFLGELMPIFEEHEQHARDLADKHGKFSRETEDRLEVLAGRTHAEIKKISGDDGRIAAKTKELEAMQEEVRKDLDAVISASHKVGAGARKILETILDIFKDAAKKKGEDDGKSKKEDKPSAGESAPESSEDVHGGIEDITSGAVGAALQKLRRDRAKVEVLYREIAGLKSGLATAKKIDSECGAYGRSVRDVMRPAQEIADAWTPGGRLVRGDAGRAGEEEGPGRLAGHGDQLECHQVEDHPEPGGATARHGHRKLTPATGRLGEDYE